ncbi:MULTISPECIES: hypothetical protein [unclassified Chitinophaga]|uniref:hypothetical protein n=1 Tax=unclassified Chitinophaga TaxID=2619133 RepID=UPI0030105C96
MPTPKKAKLLDPKHEPLTPEKLRELSGLDLPDEQAEETILSLRRYAHILFKHVNLQKQTVKKNQPGDDK